MPKDYSISDFYMYLKLGLWKSGTITDLGRVERIASIKNDNESSVPGEENKNNFFPDYYLRQKNLIKYIEKPYCKRMLANGVYLMDFYLQSKNNNKEDQNTYILVISTGRFGLEKREFTHILRIESTVDNLNLIPEMTSMKKSRKRRSIFSKRSRSQRPQFVPRRLTGTEI